MHSLHHHPPMISQLRSFLAVVQEGSLHRAAMRLHLSQSALSRQMQALEHELGGKLLERSSTGVRATNAGHALAAKMRTFLAGYDAAMLEVRRLVRGQAEGLRIGYLASAFAEYLDPALKKVRQVHPRTKVKLLDLRARMNLAHLFQSGVEIFRECRGEIADPESLSLAAHEPTDFKHGGIVAGEECPHFRRECMSGVGGPHTRGTTLQKFSTQLMFQRLHLARERRL